MRIPSLRRLVIHLAVMLGFAVLAIAWTFPLVSQLSTHLPGAGLGDSAIFFWNFWWMRATHAAGTSFFHTAYLFAPAGADITLHTHTALPAFIGATLLKNFSVVAALNITIIASLALNGFCAYLLAWRTVRQRGPAILAGIIFGTSPYIAAHLVGHFNLTTTWTIPLFAICVIEMAGATGAVRASMKWAALAGVVLAATAYIDYYYVIYEIAFACVVLLMTARRWSARIRVTAVSRRWLAVLIALIGLDVILVIATQVTGGFSVQLGSIHLSMHDPFNLEQLLVVLTAAALWVRFGPVVSAQRIDGWRLSRTAASVAVMLAVFLIGIAPLVKNAMRLFADGQYVTQHYQWRHSPIGVDLLTLFLGNPIQSLWGGFVTHVYARLGINAIESVAWLGIVPIVLAIVAVRNRRADPAIPLWAAIGGIFFVWALGSHIQAAGHYTGLIMPEVLLRYVPIAANARMPGRAMVIVYLALGVLAAAGMARAKWRRPRVIVAAACALVLADSWIAPLPTAAASCPPIYQVLRDRPEPGTLAELPLGIGDGFGAITQTDARMLVCQAVHGRPIVGGLLARLPPNVMTAYRADPLIAAWLQLSGAAQDVVPLSPLPDGSAAARRLAADDISFVMLNRRFASPELRDFVERVMPLTVVTQDAERTLYRVSPPPVR